MCLLWLNIFTKLADAAGLVGGNGLHSLKISVMFPVFVAVLDKNGEMVVRDKGGVLLFSL